MVYLDPFANTKTYFCIVFWCWTYLF